MVLLTDSQEPPVWGEGNASDLLHLVRLLNEPHVIGYDVPHSNVSPKWVDYISLRALIHEEVDAALNIMTLGGEVSSKGVPRG